jgi:hypothetical protein
MTLQSTDSLLEDTLRERTRQTRVRLEQGLQVVGADMKKIFQKKPKKKKAEAFESIDHVKVYSIAAKQLSATKKKDGAFALKRSAATYWLMCTAIGIGTGIMAYFSHQGLAGIQGIRISISRYFMTLPGVNWAFGMFLAWLTYMIRFNYRKMVILTTVVELVS